MKLNALTAECTAYDFNVMLEEKKPKSWLKSVSAFANGLGGSHFFGIINETKALEEHKDELKPVFKSTPSQFQTIIFATSDTQNIEKSYGEVLKTKLTEHQLKILNLIKESSTITGKTMSETLCR